MHLYSILSENKITFSKNESAVSGLKHYDDVIMSARWRLKSHCLRKRFFTGKSKKTLKLCVTGLCEGKSPVTGEFSAQRVSHAENVSVWWRHHECPRSCQCSYFGRWVAVGENISQQLTTDHKVIKSLDDYITVPNKEAAIQDRQ